MIDGQFGLTAKRLKELLLYDKTTGNFTWLDSGGRKRKGCIAGELKPSGYVLIGVDGHRYRAHRLAWLYVTNEWPSLQIDHCNNIRNDNRWCNLRIADNAQNQANSKRPKNNTSGAKGVYWNYQRMAWAAKINPGRKQVHLGFFETVEEASAAYQEGAKLYFKEFARSS